ncbi:hypothetical protein SNK19_14205 [Ralstonia pseudosolanacearum]|uniref:hypothetical protein n=1 Tax=Ralstonia pseudosolanacearum TaxID=1310165 RepID=UPI003CF1A040
MRKHFPAVEAATRAWVNVADQDGLREKQFLTLLDEYVPAELLLVEVHRKVAGYLPKADAIQFIGEHLSHGTIRICDREFHGFVVVTVNGVATGWASPRPEER